MTNSLNKSNMEDIIVYIVDINYVGENQYINVVFDFRSEKDYHTFCKELGFETNTDDEESFLFQISNIMPQKHLHKDSYYKLNLDVLKALKSQLSRLG